MTSNRIDHLALTTTSPRQTPKSDFGECVSQAMGTTAKVGLGLGAALMSGNPAAVVGQISSAMSSVPASRMPASNQVHSASSSVTAGNSTVGGYSHSAAPVPGHGTTASAQPSQPPASTHSSQEPVLSAAVASSSSSGSAPAGSTAAPAEGGSAMELQQLQASMQADSQAFQMQYIKLQDQMQAESRSYNTITNVMKTRHDSAKAAINNIR